MQAQLVDETDFLTRLRAGRREAQTELFLRHRRWVTRVLYRVLGNDPDIADLVQDVFYQALRGVKHYRGDPRGHEPWLRRITVFVASGLMRKRAVRRRYFTLSVPEQEELIPATVATPEQVESLTRVYAIFDKLPERERVPLTLSLVSDMSPREIADTCGISASTLKRRLIRARARFQTLAAHDPALSARLARASERRVRARPASAARPG